MDLMVNSLPTRTWNRLGMNETKLNLEGDFTNKTPQAQSHPAEVLWEPKATAVPGGLHGELEALAAQADIGLAETKPAATPDKPLVLHYHYKEGEQGVSRLVLHAAEDSTLQAVLLLTSEGASTAALQIEGYADKNAKIELYVAQLLDQRSVYVQNICGVCEDAADISLHKLELGAGKLYAGINVDLKGVGSTLQAEVGYHGKPEQVLDMNYVATHLGKNTQSRMDMVGTLENGAKKIFRGTIDFQRGCAGAKGDEMENVLLLGNDVVNQTIPLILCQEEDVEGNHGASIGELDEKVLFYMASRGIDAEMAQKLIAEARIEAICNTLPDEAVQAQVRDYEGLGGIDDEQEL